MRNISLFENFIKEVGSLSLAKIIEQIRGSKYKEPVSEIRKLVERGDYERAGRIKKGIYAFTASGLFSGGPKMNFLKTYNPFVILDINELDSEVLPYLVLKIKEIEFTKAVFISPSGRGLKVIVEVDTEMKLHSLAYRQVCDFYKKKLRIEIEKSGDDITQLCFMSHDPEAYFNPESVVYKISASDFEIGIDQGPTDFIPKNVSDLTNQEMINRADNRASLEVENGAMKYPRKSIRRISTVFPPAIPLQVYSKLPALLKKSCKPFKDRHQKRDVFLTGALGVLSGLLSGISGVYDGQVYSPNLFVFAAGPATSNKGAFNLTRYLGTAYQKELLEVNNKQQEVYRKALVKFEMDLVKYKKGFLKREPEAPKQPNFRNLFSPTNMDGINLMEHLNRNEESGILFESEVDSLTNAPNHSWGEYSDVLRKAFHHEALLYNRKSDGDLIAVNRPKLSVALSGTLDQLTYLIPTAEDGLLSRFMFYAFEGEVAWQEVSKKGKIPNAQMFYKELSKGVLEVISFLKFYPAEFTLTEAQWKILNATFKKMVKETKEDFGIEALSIVRRMGLICFRIAMVLSAIRKYQEKRLEKELVCHKSDFQAAILLAETYLKHGLFVYDHLSVSSLERSSFRRMGA